MSLLLTSFLSGTGQLRAQEPAVVLLQPQTLSLDQGETGRVVVRIENAANVFGVQIDLAFDAGQIRVLDADESRPGVQLAAGDFLTAEDGFEAANQVDNEEGHLIYAYSRLAPAGAVSGDGALFSFEIEALQSGLVDLRVGPAIIASPEGAELAVHVAENRGDEGQVIVPTLPATPPALTTVATPYAERRIADATPTITRYPTASTQAEPEPAVASGNSMAEEGTPMTETEVATAISDLARERPTRGDPGPVDGDEQDLVVTMTSTPERANNDPAAAEVAAVAATAVQERSLPAPEGPTAEVAVIGQDLQGDERATQAPAPATAAEDEGQVDSIFLALVLIVVVAAFIVFWFIRRLQH